MPLLNHQYEALMREYDARRMQHELDAEERRQAIYRQYPDLEKNHAALTQNAVRLAKARIFHAPDISSLETERENLSEERRELIAAAGLTENDFLPKYTCKECGDTGFVNGRKCRCFKAREIRLLYENSHLETLLSRENFDTLRMDLYSREPRENAPSVYEEMQKHIAACRAFAENFPEDPPRNLLLYGRPGLGKTFLTNCIAKALLDRGFSVLYYSSISLFDRLAKIRFGKTEDDGTEELDSMFECDLLVIDDLGTELTNALVESQLFHLVNERLLSRKSTIISTNMSLTMLAKTYSERTGSRIISNYEAIQLTGEDLRSKMKLEADHKARKQ